MNTSGLTPCEYNVIVKQKQVEEKSTGGIILTDDMQEREKFDETRGTLIAMSPKAFDESIWPEGVEKPEVGSEVVWSRYAGMFTEGTDGEEYRIIKDKDIVAIVEKNDG